MEEIVLSFLFNNKKTIMQCKRDEYLKDIFKRYVIKINQKLENIYFLYNGERLNMEKKIEEINNIDNNINILVYLNNNGQNNDKILKQSKQIICPKCKEICIFNFENYQINLNQCSNSHNIGNIIINEFIDSQIINE